MESDPVLLKIYDVLCEIKELIAKGASAPAASGQVYKQQTSTTGEIVIPQPAKIIDNPGDVQIHFGKNNGKPLSSLSERSLEWYASVKEPKLDSSGKPYTPRPQEILLENAARTLWHTQKGTMNLASNQTHPPSAEKPKNNENEEEQVPF